jgi:hypothetical protein
MNAKWINALSRITRLAVALAIAGIVVWRGSVGSCHSSLLGASMCALFALTIAATGLALTFETDESR